MYDYYNSIILLYMRAQCVRICVGTCVRTCVPTCMCVRAHVFALTDVGPM